MDTLKNIASILILCLLLASQPVWSQVGQSENPEEPKWGIKFTGFVRSDFWHDSRMIRGSREDLFNFYPQNENIKTDSDGVDVDVNNIGNVHGSIAASRLTGVIFTPDVFNAKAAGIIEADFSGSNNAGLNQFRIRHAYFKFSWEKSELIVGQTWHPMFVTEVFPDVVSLNTGAPFQPFIRNPLIQLSYNVMPELKIIGAAITQRDNATIYPVTGAPDPTPLRYSKIPNLHAQIQYKNNSIVAGLAADYKCVRPRILTNDGSRFNEEYLSSTAFMAYFKYTAGDFVFRAKAIKGQNMTEHLMLGGYAVEHKDSVTQIETYLPYNHLFFWINPAYGKKYSLGMFAGYAINLGTSKNTDGSAYYSLFPDMKDIEKMYRIAPNFSVSEGKFKACIEYEHTGAYFGTPDKNDKNLVKNSKLVYNNRISLTFYYFF